jgi:hypothetical protein
MRGAAAAAAGLPLHHYHQDRAISMALKDVSVSLRHVNALLALCWRGFAGDKVTWHDAGDYDQPQASANRT